MPWKQTAAADAVLGIVFVGRDAVDELDSRPHAARILPAAAGAAEPFAENRPGGDEPAVLAVELAGERANLAGGAHADGDQAAEQRRRDGQPRAFRNVVDLAD